MSSGASRDGRGAHAEDPENRQFSPRFERVSQIAGRFIAPAAAALALVSVLTPAAEPDHDIALIAPRSARAGEPLPLRVLLYAGLSAIEGPRLVHARVSVALRDASGAAIASTQLRPGHGPSLEGALSLSNARPGAYTLIAIASTQDGAVRVERPLQLSTGAPGETLTPAPRALRALQQLQLEPIAEVNDAVSPAPFDVRVAGGACVPEEACELLVHVGEPAALLRADSTPSVTVERVEPRDVETSGVVALSVRTHGPEARLELIALRALSDGAQPAPVARRFVRVPVALGADAMQLERASIARGEKLQLGLAGAAPRAIADVFEDGRWLYTSTHAGMAALDRSFGPGLVRVQLRRDPFRSESAASRSVFVRDGSAADALRTLGETVLARYAVDERAAYGIRRVAGLLQAGADPALSAPELERRARYLLAWLDTDLYELPAASHGYPLAQARVAAHRADIRRLALLVLALAAVSLALLVVQRGLRGSADAQAVLRASGVDLPQLSRARLRTTLRVVGAAVSLLLAFFAIALYLIARGRGQ